MRDRATLRAKSRGARTAIALGLTLLAGAALGGCSYTGAAQGYARDRAALAVEQKRQLNDDRALLARLSLCDQAIGGMDQWSTMFQITALRECLSDTDQLEQEMMRQMMQRMRLEAPGV